MIRRRFHCDTCGANQGESERKSAPPLWVTVTESGSNTPALHFCQWDCVLKYAARFDPPIIIPSDSPPGEASDPEEED